MKAFADWYFSWGWIAFSVLSGSIGIYCGLNHKPNLFAWSMLAIFSVGLIAILIRHPLP